MLFDPSIQGVIIRWDVQFNEVSYPHEFIEFHVTLNFPSPYVTPIYVTTSSSFVQTFDPNSLASSSDPPKCPKDTSVVPITTPVMYLSS